MTVDSSLYRFILRNGHLSFFFVASLVSGQANKEEFHKVATNSSINCNERTESSNHFKPPDCETINDIVSDQTNKEFQEFHKETIYDSVSVNFQDNKGLHNETTNLSKLLDRETVYDSLKPPGCETKYDLDIKHSELTDLKVFESGGFGLKNKDFDRELAALKTSKYCKEYIIQFYGLSQDYLKESIIGEMLVNRLVVCEMIVNRLVVCEMIVNPESGNYILVMQFADNGTLKDYLKEQKEQLDLSRKIYLNKAILKGLKFLHDQGIVHRDL
ncbi:11401_t:CDS:2, partial [Gigaspora rosea]